MDTQTRRENATTTEDEIRMMELQAKKCEGVQATTRRWKRHGRILPQGTWKVIALWTP